MSPQALFFRQLLHHLANLIGYITHFYRLCGIIPGRLLVRHLVYGSCSPLRLGAGFIQGAVARQGHAPGLQIPDFFERLLAFPHLDHDILHHVFGFLGIVQKAQCESEKLVL